jgi:hypothetical protein
MRSTTDRGYGTAHQRERKRLTPTVNAGNAYCMQAICLMQSRWIPPGTAWALGHNDQRTAWIGPTHAPCNQHDGASKGGRVIAARHRRGWHPTTRHPAPTDTHTWHSRTW